jgi:hypothetical protein
MCSLIGNISRFASISSVTSSVPGSIGSLGNGPLDELIDEYASGSRHTATASS